MKYTVIQLVIIALTTLNISLSIYAQDSVNVTVDKRFIDVVNSKQNILYQGIDNPLKINTENNENLIIKTNNGIVYKDNGVFVAIPSKIHETELKIFETNENQDTILIYRAFLQTIRFPMPLLKLGDKVFDEMKEIDRNFLIQCDTIGIFFTDDIIGIENWYKITSYSFGYIYGNHYISFDINGNILDINTKKRLLSLSSGTEIIIRVTIISNSNISIKRPIFRAILY